MSDVVMDCAKEVYGKQGAAAAHVGKDEGNFSRDVKRAAAQIEQLGPEVLARIGKELVDRFGPLADPKDRARRVIHDIETLLVELKQFVEVA